MSLLRAVLVLNTSYEAVNVCSAQRAMILICKGAAVVQEPSSHFLHTPKMKLPLPSVIRLVNYRYVPRHTRSVSRKNIMERDGYVCQYCGAKLPASKLTMDHVTPKSRGGRALWENLVACCHPCNNRKSDRTPAEAGMPLIRRPLPFSIHVKHRSAAAESGGLWDKYLFC
jgi:5-methylcytosine-specific restriction endonuclease McrA